MGRIKRNVLGTTGDFTEGLRRGFSCETPGMKIRSKGKGRGLARGRGKGPIGVPRYSKKKGLGFGDFSNLG